MYVKLNFLKFSKNTFQLENVKFLNILNYEKKVKHLAFKPILQ